MCMNFIPAYLCRVLYDLVHVDYWATAPITVMPCLGGLGVINNEVNKVNKHEIIFSPLYESAAAL